MSLESSFRITTNKCKEGLRDFTLVCLDMCDCLSDLDKEERYNKCIIGIQTGPGTNWFFFFFVSVQSCRSTTAVIVNSCTSCITGCCTISDICNYEIIHCHLYKNIRVLTRLCHIHLFVVRKYVWMGEKKSKSSVMWLIGLKMCLHWW